MSCRRVSAQLVVFYHTLENPFCIQTKLHAWGETVGAQCPGLDERLLWFRASWVQTLADSQLLRLMCVCDTQCWAFYISLSLCNYIATPPYSQDATDFHFHAVSCFLFFSAGERSPVLSSLLALKTKSWAQICRHLPAFPVTLSMFTPQSSEMKQKNVGGIAPRSSRPIWANAVCVVETCISFFAGNACWATAFCTQQHCINLTLALSGLRARRLHNTYMRDGEATTCSSALQ